MKKFFAIVFASLIVMVLVTACTIAPAAGSTGVADFLNEFQMYWIGIVASVVLYGLNLMVKAYPKIVIKRDWLTIGLYVIAFGFSVLWGGMVIPAFAAFNDPPTFFSALFSWINAFLIAAGPVVAFATLIYNVLLKRVLDHWTGKK